MKMEKKNPLLAGLINFFIWGGGYLYIGKKQTLGFGLIFVAILEHSPLLILGLGIVTTYARARVFVKIPPFLPFKMMQKLAPY